MTRCTRPGTPRRLATRQVFAAQLCAIVISLAPAHAGPQPAGAPTAVRDIASLPRKPLPSGRVYAWCGNERVLMEQPDKGGAVVKTRWLQQAAGQERIPLPPLKGDLTCDAAGAHIIVDRFGEMGGKIGRVGVTDRSEDILATYVTAYGPDFALAVSPDGASIAFDSESVRVDLDKAHESIRPVPLGHGQQRIPASVQWSADSSAVLNAVRKDAADGHQEAVQLIDLRNGRDIAGDLPPGAWFEKGIILPGNAALLLFVRPSFDEIKQAPGSVLGCRVSSAITCRTLLSGLDEVTFSDDGLIASVKELRKPPGRRHDGDSVIAPDAFVAQIHNKDGRLIAEQRLQRKNPEVDLKVVIAPNGRAALMVHRVWSAKSGWFEDRTTMVSLDGSAQ